ncbi:MAG: ABC transporter permease [Clostridiales Family XIII bacterium]|jgi:NitT/TauT family transport system permease protein|nr:ABC transporter permease [Clostridiales Family XIII bacterium]
METKEQSRLFTAYQKSVVIILVLAAWSVFPHFMKNNMFLPPFLDIMQTLWEMVRSGEMGKHLLASLRRAGIGLAIAEAAAIPVGIGLGWFARFENYLDPLLTALRNLSVLTILPLFVLFLGIGEVSKTAIIVWGCFFPQLVNTISGVKNVDPVLIQSARSMGMSNFSLFQKVILPGSMTYTLTGFRLSASIALLVLVGAEMLGADFGLGHMIFHYQQAFLIKKMYCGILVMIIVGVVVNTLIARLESRLTIWQDKGNAH